MPSADVALPSSEAPSSLVGAVIDAGAAAAPPLAEEAVVVRHPIGREGAPSRGSPVTSANVEVLDAVLGLYYADRELPGDCLANRVNLREDRSRAAVGLELDPRMVSRLEISSALDALARAFPMPFTCVDLAYRQRLTRKQIAQDIGRSPAQVTAWLNVAFEFLIRRIWRRR